MQSSRRAPVSCVIGQLPGLAIPSARQKTGPVGWDVREPRTAAQYSVPKDISGSYCVTVPSGVRPRVSEDDSGSGTDGLHSEAPCQSLIKPPVDAAGECEGIRQISIKISALPGAVLSENQHTDVSEPR